MNYQHHSADVLRAEARLTRRARGDGLWTDERGLPLLALAADCLPIALARANGGTPALAVLHAGWRGLLGGIASAGVQALGGGARLRGRSGRDRPVLLRGRGGGRRRPSAARSGSASCATEARPLERRRASACAPPAASRGRPHRPLHGMPRPSASSRTVATRASRGRQGVIGLYRLTTIRAQLRAHPRRARRRR